MRGKGAWAAAIRHDWRSALRQYRAILNYRLANRLMDRRAVLAGACNATTWSEATHSFRGGYSHWRCAKAAGHPGWHRSNNYRWAPGDTGRVLYDPIPVRVLNQDNSALIPFQSYANGRHLTATSRQDRLMDRLAEANLRLARQKRLREETAE